MDYADAVKKVRAEKPKENFMTLEFNYDHKFVLPHKDGVALLAAFANAERLVDRYNEKPRIEGVDRDSVIARQFSASEYELYKVAALLNLSPSEVKEMMEAANKPTPVTTS